MNTDLHRRGHHPGEEPREPRSGEIFIALGRRVFCTVRRLQRFFLRPFRANLFFATKPRARGLVPRLREGSAPQWTYLRKSAFIRGSSFCAFCAFLRLFRFFHPFDAPDACSGQAPSTR
jgi:hypothetical protein